MQARRNGVENIAHARAYTTDQQLELLREAAALMCESRFALVIVDSATALYYRSGTECLAVRQRVFHLRTGSDALDTLLGGGLESASITEVYGEYRCGKTQLCHTLAVTAQAADESHAGRVVYIDTEGNFRPERIRAIATRFSIDADDVLDRGT
jgi:RecA/RadA recombinase